MHCRSERGDVQEEEMWAQACDFWVQAHILKESSRHLSASAKWENEENKSAWEGDVSLKRNEIMFSDWKYMSLYPIPGWYTGFDWGQQHGHTVYAMSALMSLYFVFAVQYPKELINTLIVIERFVLGIMDHSVVPISVKRLYNCVGSVSGSSE